MEKYIAERTLLLDSLKRRA